MNAMINNKKSSIINKDKNQIKEQNNNHLSLLSNIGSNQNRHSSENQRNNTKFNSQKKVKNNNDFLISLNDINNIKLNNFSNLIKTSKVMKKTKNKNHSLSKPKLEIEINNKNNKRIHYSRIGNNNKKYKKNISEHDLVNNILNTFTDYNFTKNTNTNTNANIINHSSKKKIIYNKTKGKEKTNIITTNTNDKMSSCRKDRERTRSRRFSDPKLTKSSSGYSKANNNIYNHLTQANSFFKLNNNQSNKIGYGYISTYGNNNTDYYGNAVKLSGKKSNNNNGNKYRNKSSKSNVIGKIIKNYKKNDLNCIFNVNLIPPVTSLNNLQDYFNNLYKVEYSGENVIKKKYVKNNKKINHNKEKEEKELKIRNNEDYSHNNNTMMTKTNDDLSKIKKDNNFQKFCNDSPEEIHFYIISSIQNGNYMENNLNKK
jgi:hypothetical protein